MQLGRTTTLTPPSVTSRLNPCVLQRVQLRRRSTAPFVPYQAWCHYSSGHFSNDEQRRNHAAYRDSNRLQKRHISFLKNVVKIPEKKGFMYYLLLNEAFQRDYGQLYPKIFWATYFATFSTSFAFFYLDPLNLASYGITPDFTFRAVRP
jgi:hypothetical protein